VASITREDNGGDINDKTRFSLGIVLVSIGLLSGWATSGLTSFVRAQERIAVMETKQSATDQKLERIEAKLDRIGSRLEAADR
jgi:hypothetical protein